MTTKIGGLALVTGGFLVAGGCTAKMLLTSDPAVLDSLSQTASQAGEIVTDSPLLRSLLGVGGVGSAVLLGVASYLKGKNRGWDEKSLEQGTPGQRKAR